MIDWVNSLAIPSCALVDSFEDLENGSVVADILSSIVGKRIEQDEEVWGRILQELSVLVDPSFQQVDPESSLLLILKTLRELMHREPAESVIPPKRLPDSYKEALKDWVLELNLQTKRQTPDTIEDSCKTGVLYAEVINRLEGRTRPVKGIERNPKTLTSALANINKCLNHLRKYSKMNGRYLWSVKEILDGDESAIWGLLEDIRSLYSLNNSSRANLSKQSVSVKEFEPYKSVILAEPVTTKKSPSKTIKNNTSKTQISPRVSLKKTETQYLYPTNDIKQEVIDWINALDIQFARDSYKTRDPVYNGILLSEIVKTLTGHTVLINPYPKTDREILSNFENAVEILKKNGRGVPSFMLEDAQVLLNESGAFWNLLFYLYTAYPYAAPLNYQQSVLSYSPIEVKRLEDAILDWLVILGIIQLKKKPTFQQVIPEMKSGLLLCEVVIRVTDREIKGVVVNPVTDTSALNNIRKGLQVLRLTKNMPQRFTWSEKEIFAGKPSVILGLLEDVMTLHKLKRPVLQEKLGPQTERPRFSVDFLRSNSSRIYQTQSFRQSPQSQSRFYTDWIRSLGVDIPSNTNFESKRIDDFKSGVLLCDIVSKVERVTIPFVSRKPKSADVALKNIERALDILRKREKLPLEGMEEEILQGKSEAVLSVLNELIKLWKLKKSFY